MFMKYSLSCKCRRRLEPLFEEETESDEEKTQQECEELKKVGYP